MFARELERKRAVRERYCRRANSPAHMISTEQAVRFETVLRRSEAEPGEIPLETLLPTLLACVIGAVSFAGSLIAFAKLQELMTGRPIVFPGNQFINGGLLLGIVVPRSSTSPRARRARACSWRCWPARSCSGCC